MKQNESARFYDNQIELSMKILLSITGHPRALYLVDLVRDKRRFLQGVGGGRPWGRTGAQLGRNL